MSIEKETLKRLAIDIVGKVKPGDIFVVEENFDAMISDWDHAASLDEGKFAGGVEIATFAAAVVPFLLAFIGDVAKDVAKDQAKKISASLLDKLLRREASVDEVERLRSEIEVAIARSKASREQKDILSNGFARLFSTCQSPPQTSRTPPG